jgi:hypothetical protein
MAPEADWKADLRDLEKHKLSILVRYDGKTLFRSDKPGMEPLVELLEANMNNLVGTTVIVRSLGIAAAKLLLWQHVMRIDALVASRPAEDLLRPSGIAVNVRRSVERITDPKTHQPCRYETLGVKFDHPEELYSALRSELLIFPARK